MASSPSPDHFLGEPVRCRAAASLGFDRYLKIEAVTAQVSL